LSNAENILIVLSSASIKCRWLTYVLGYAAGKNLNCHIYAINLELKNWSSAYSISTSMEDLLEYYKFYNHKWFEEAAIRIAKKTLIDLYRDITLTAFVEVVKEGDCLLAGIYMDAGYKPIDKDKNGVPLICWAARKRKLPMIKLLMQAGADINAVSGDRDNTALIDAVSEDDVEIVSFILDYNPDLEKESRNGQTALIIASGHNNADIVKLLMDKGAATDTKDKLGMSAVSYAKMQQNEVIIKLLTPEE
jgi:ankyrin repeat protein